jgi:cytidyltransferase-like protein
MGVKEAAVRLYLRQVEDGGIPAPEYFSLRNMERHMLEKEGGNGSDGGGKGEGAAGRGKGGNAKGARYFLKPEYREKFTVAMTGGVFDVIHIGHIDTLSRAKEKADVLVVVVARDAHIEKKKRKPLHSQEYRRVLVQALKPVDLAVLGRENAEETLGMVGPDVIVYGYDQKAFLKPKGVKVVELKGGVDPKNVKTSRILKKLGI